LETAEAVSLVRAMWLMLALPLLLTGCQNNIYYWGHYEGLIYVTYAKPGKISPELQVDTMQKDLHLAEAANKPVPPGFHAQLGYLYYQTGKPELARQEFENEKKLFPESSVFMDRMLGNLTQK
jgi:hypothetical protein